MIPASRFLVQSRHRDEWLDARARGVTATTAAKAATPAGFRDAVANVRDDAPDNPYYEFGREAEHGIMRFAHHEHGILENDWLLAGEDARWLATPDGLSPDHALIAEAKTTTKDWNTVPAVYRRQVQWQLLVTGAERCLFLWQLTVPTDTGWFYTGWLEPKFRWIEPDADVQRELVDVAERLWEARHGELQGAA